MDDFVIFEARRNLGAKGQDALDALDRLLQSCRHSRAQRAGPTVRHEDVHGLPEKDRPVLAAAIHLRCDVLLTGDRTHFGSNYGKTVAGVVIHSPRSLAEALFI